MVQTRRSRGSGSIFWDEKEGRYVGLTPRQTNKAGKEVRLRVSGATREEAEARLVRLMDQLTAGKPVDSMQFSALAERWLEKHPKAGPSTKSMYRWFLDHDLLPLFGHRAISDIDLEEIEDLLTARAHLARNTLIKLRSTLSQVYDYARRHDHGLVNKAKLAAVPVTAKPPKESVALKPHEVGLFVKTAQEERLYPWVRVLVETGARPSEVSALRHSDLDEEASTVSLSNAKLARIGQAPPKPRRVKVTTETWKAIAAMRVANEEEAGVSARAGHPWPESDLVFVSKHGTPLNDKNMGRWVRRLAARAGIERASTYTFRHSLATNMVEAGKSLEQVAETLGHRDTRTPMKYYVHLSDDIDHNEGIYDF